LAVSAKIEWMLAANSAAVSRQSLRGPGVLPPWQGSGAASVLGGMMTPPSVTFAPPPLPLESEPPLPLDDAPPLPDEELPPFPDELELPPLPEPEPLPPEPEPLPPFPLPLPLPPDPVMTSPLPRPAQPPANSSEADATKTRLDRYIRPPGGPTNDGRQVKR
jgi:protein TonB